MKSDLDRIDCALVAALQKDGRRSNKELAASVGLAPSSCLQRVRRLRRDGVITGIHAKVHPEAVGVGLQAMVAITLADHAPGPHDALMGALRQMEEVVAMFSLGGSVDLLVYVAVRDTEHLRDLVHGDITSQPPVGRVETMILFEHEWRELPIYL